MWNSSIVGTSLTVHVPISVCNTVTLTWRKRADGEEQMQAQRYYNVFMNLVVPLSLLSHSGVEGTPPLQSSMTTNTCMPRVALFLT